MKSEEIFLPLRWGSNFAISAETGRTGESLVRVWVLPLTDSDKRSNAVAWACRLTEADDEPLNSWAFYRHQKVALHKKMRRQIGSRKNNNIQNE